MKTYKVWKTPRHISEAATIKANSPGEAAEKFALEDRYGPEDAVWDLHVSVLGPDGEIKKFSVEVCCVLRAEAYPADEESDPQ